MLCRILKSYGVKLLQYGNVHEFNWPFFLFALTLWQRFITYTKAIVYAGAVMTPGNPSEEVSPSTLPKFKKIKAYILDGIASKSFIDALPSENKLADFFSVSRMTARKAMDELEREGFIVRVNGKGSFVKGQKHYSGFFRVRPFRLWARDLNVTPSTKVLNAGVVEPPDEEARLLGWPRQVVRVVRLSYFDNLPVRYAIHYICIEMAAGILMDDLEKESIHELLAKKYRVEITKISQDLMAVNLPEQIADAFNVAPGYPAFHFKRVEYSNNRPVCYVHYFMRGELSFRDVFSPKFDASLHRG